MGGRMFGLLRTAQSVRGAGLRGIKLQNRWLSTSHCALSKIMYTDCDEAPLLATFALLPIIQRFAKPMGIEVEKTDISVAGRLLAHFPERLTPEQRVPDNLAMLGELAKTPEGNIIKTPNISASIPQLLECIAELQAKGYNVPDYPADPKTPEEAAIKATYGKVLGSAVNPVLREGNSDRRCAPPVKENAKRVVKRSPAMRPWKENGQRACVSTMSGGDFFENEQSHIMPEAGSVNITLHQADGTTVVLKEGLKLQKGEVIDATKMDTAALCEFFEKEIQDCKDKNLMMSLHMKATMMKVSDPIIFGHCVKVYFKDVFAKHGALLAELKVNVNNGLGDLYEKIKGHPKEAEIIADIDAAYATRPGLAMVDSDKGITNLHVPSDVIIDASMPNVVRDGGQMWNKADKLEEVKCIIPDRSYSTMYDAIIKDYLTDLFPILELGTSAKMLSIVPLLAGGVLLETGAGCSAPKHVEQLLKENHLRWDSLGEYLATAIGFQELGDRTNSDNAKLLGETMMNAVGKWLENDKTPGRKVKQIDNRGSNFYVALYWAEELAAKK